MLILSVFSRVVSISLCSEKDNFLSASLDRTVLLWDLRADKAQVQLMILSCKVLPDKFQCLLDPLFLPT
jgi:WD40 repeat protein